MSNNELRHSPRRGPGMRNAPPEKAKNFKQAIKRLFSELGKFRVLIIISIILAIIGAVLSIIAPSRLSNLTDEISEGLVINSDNIEKLSKQIIENTQTGNMQEINIDGTVISIEDQMEFMQSASNMENTEDVNQIYGKLDEMPDSIKTIIEPKMNMDKIKQISLFLAVLYISSALFTFIQAICMTDVANKFAKNLRSRISIKINKLPLRYFDKNLAGDILSRVTNDVDTIAQTMNQSLGSLVTSVTLFVGTIIMMFITNWIMALTAIFASLIGFILMFIILGKSQKYFVERQKQLGQLNGHIEEIYSGLNVVKHIMVKKHQIKNLMN